MSPRDQIVAELRMLAPDYAVSEHEGRIRLSCTRPDFGLVRANEVVFRDRASFELELHREVVPGPFTLSLTCTRETETAALQQLLSIVRDVEALR